MADISINKGNGGRFLPQVTGFDPFRFWKRKFGRTRDVSRWDPFYELTWPFERDTDFFPDFEVKETKDALVFAADLPGVNEKDVEVSLTGNRLTIRGKREAAREEKGETWYAAERAYGSFARSFTLPEGVDVENIRANLDHGVLNVSVPKLVPAKPKRVAVKVTEKV